MLKQLLQWLQGFLKWLSGGKWIASHQVAETKQPPPLTNSDLEFLFTQVLEGVYQARGQEWALRYLQRMEHRISNERWLEWLQGFGDRLLASHAPNAELASRLVQLGELDIGDIGECAYEIGIQLMTRNLSNGVVDSGIAELDAAESSSQQVWEYQEPDYFSQYQTEADSQPGEAWEYEFTRETEEEASNNSHFSQFTLSPEDVSAPTDEQPAWEYFVDKNQEEVSSDTQLTDLPPPLPPPQVWEYAAPDTQQISELPPPLPPPQPWQEPFSEANDEEIEISPTTLLNSYRENHEIQGRYTPTEEVTPTQTQNQNLTELQAPVADTLDELLVRLQQSASLVRQLSYGLQNQPMESPPPSQKNFNTEAQRWFFQGLQQAKNGNLPGALSSYERAIAIQPQAYEYWFNTGLTLFHLDNYDAALTYYQRAIALKPDLYQGWYHQGIALAAGEKLTEAIAAFDQALAIQPDYETAWADRGWVLWRLKQYQPAIASYDQALHIQPQNPVTLCHKGMALAAVGELPSAIKNYGAALKIQPNYVDVWYHLGDSLVQLGKSEDAIAYYERATEIDPDYYQAWCGRATALYNLGHYNEALASCDTALEINPKYERGWYQRGIILSGVGNQEEAITAYNQALEIAPQFDLPWLQRGISLYQLGNWEAAVTSFERVHDIAPQNYESWYFQGTALDKLGRWEESITAYEQASQIQPDFHDVWVDKGVALIQLGKLEAAIAAWDRALELKSDLHLAWYNRGVALDNLKRYTEAISSYDQAVYIQPDFELAWYHRGLTLFYFEQYEEAIASYDQVLEIKPDYWEAWMSRAKAAEKSTSYAPHLRVVNSITEKNPSLNQRGYYGKLASYQEGLKYIYPDTHPEPWGKLHLAIGNTLYEQGRRDRSCRDYWLQAVTEYELSLSTLTPQDFPQLHIEVLQSLITALLGLGQIHQAQQLHDQGMNVWGYLLSHGNLTDAGKKQLSLKAASLGQLAVDLAIKSGEFVSALEIAEQGKNAYLTWQLYGWNEQIYSPDYKSIQKLLNPQCAIIYWHISPHAIHTFVVKHKYPEPMHIFTPVFNPGEGNEFHLPEAVQLLVELEDWIQEWDWQYQEYQQVARDKQSKKTHSWRLLMGQRLAHLREILNIANIEEELQDINQLILIPHRDLHRFPLHELFEQNSRYKITYLPSTEMGLTAEAKKFDISSQSSLLSVSTGYSQLKFAQLQTEIVNQIFPNCTLLSLGEATQERVEKTLDENYKILHFTGYGVNNFNSPHESALLLPGDEKLTLLDICKHSLKNYQVVTLGAIENIIPQYQGNFISEYVGINSGFLNQGASYVITPLWSVESAASTIVIVKFYRNLCMNQSPIEALAAATQWLRSVTARELVQWYQDLLSDLGQAELVNRADLATELYRLQQMSIDEQPYAHPYYWAAFAVVGNY